MLTKILFSYFSLPGLTALAQRITDLLSSAFPENPMISPLLAQLKPQLETAVQAIGSTQKQPLTEKVKEADRKRDNSFRSLRDHVKSGLQRENEAYRTACEVLWTEFDKNGLQIFSLPREKETAALMSLLNDLRKPKNLEYLQTVNATEWVNEIDRDNQLYVSTTQERSAVRSGDTTVADAQAFKNLKDSLELLENLLNVLYAMNTPAEIGGVADEISQYIREANTAARIQKWNKPVDNKEETL
ncbi:DUF6261 family protein [Prolixibacteraceae bacterium Z1-6]|uniref:DUF6261 family protein n=1 Tax=Draconibacterium aestuarii TaxID=2998507 RepID=A0A9X3J9U9_9BACT|nr:DUF6261 family protein [Prolixibacteraceae bacterium Z1-6]